MPMTLAAGFGLIKVNMAVKRGMNEQEILPRAATSVRTTAAASSCASSNTWMSAPPTAGEWTRSGPRPRSSNALPQSFPSCRLKPVRLARRPSVGVCRWRRRARGDQQRHADLLPWLQPGACFDRRSALHLPFCGRGARSSSAVAPGSGRYADCFHHRPPLGRASRSLFGASHGQRGREPWCSSPIPGRDELHRWLKLLRRCPARRRTPSAGRRDAAARDPGSQPA
jgi:hypothetical protein